MIFFLLSILGMLVQLGVMVGIVVLIIRFASNRNNVDEHIEAESAGVIVRRVFVYGIMLAMVVLVAIGIGGLVDAAAPNEGALIDDNSSAAMSFAFVIVGLPILIGLSRFTARKLREDPKEQASLGWGFYLTAALTGSLITTMALFGGVLGEIAQSQPPDSGTAIHAVIWLGVWVVHWVIADRWEPRLPEFHLLLGSATGLIWSTVGAIATLGAVLSTIYDKLLLEAVVGGGTEDLLRPAMVLVVGLPVWWWYWLKSTRSAQPTPLWHAYVLLLGVLSGAVIAITGAGISLYSVLAWFIDSPGTSGADHFSAVPGSLASVAVGVAIWMYHGSILGGRGSRERVEVDRVYDHLLAATGLVVASIGIVTLLTTVITQVFGGTSITDSEGVVTVASTLLIVGTPLWWRYWSTIQRYRQNDPASELRSIPRRIYIAGLFGIAAVVAVISLVTLVFIVFERFLAGEIAGQTISDAAVAIALIVTTGILSWYHFAILREDRAKLTLLEPTPPDEESESVEAPRDEPFRVGAGMVPSGSLEGKLRELAADGQSRVTVTITEDGFLIEQPLDR